MAREYLPAFLRACDLHDVAKVGVEAFAHDFQHLRRAHGMHVILECGQCAVQIEIVLPTLVLLAHHVQTDVVLVVQPLAVEENDCRLVDVEDDAFGELPAGRLHEVEAREPADRVARPHKRRRDE